MDALSPCDPISTLPRLAFGDAGAWISRNCREAEEKVGLRIASLEGYEPDGNRDEFGIKLAHVNINGLILTAQASSPTKLRVGTSRDLHVVIPLVGGANTITADRQYLWRAGESIALFAAGRQFLGLSERKSVISAKLDPARFRQIFDAMTPGLRQFNVAEILRTRLLNLQYGEVNFTSLFWKFATLVDSVLPNERAAGILGLDDVFYRHLALMLAPDLFFSEDNTVEKTIACSQAPIDLVCDAVRDLTNDPLTLTGMEKLSGLSARSLQYAFQKRFGCSPMAWQRRERLYLANTLLISSDDTQDITSICYLTGFSTPSKFSEYYRRQFGESPSETMRRSRRKMKNQ